MLRRSEAIDVINELGTHKTPFLFFTDFTGEKAWVKPLSKILPEEVSYQIGPFSSGKKTHSRKKDFTFRKDPIPFSAFEAPFNQVVHEISIGNSFLVNLTFKTPIQTSLSLQEIFDISQAKYKLRYKDQFVVFSPETFVKIVNGNIYSYPMKGTIDAQIPDAASKILRDTKETAEHVTIVDLIRNDLSQVAETVEVTKFRFITEVKTHEKTLLQVSSEIKGKLHEGYQNKLGTLLFQLLPAGSISGAPKPSTIAIIQAAEQYQRGFYTGICGAFDGENLDTGVMIRFIEKEGNQLFYKSGGGITSFSNAAKEYQEIIDKIYVPV